MIQSNVREGEEIEAKFKEKINSIFNKEKNILEEIMVNTVTLQLFRMRTSMNFSPVRRSSLG